MSILEDLTLKIFDRLILLSKAKSSRLDRLLKLKESNNYQEYAPEVKKTIDNQIKRLTFEIIYKFRYSPLNIKLAKHFNEISDRITINEFKLIHSLIENPDYYKQLKYNRKMKNVSLVSFVILFILCYIFCLQFIKQKDDMFPIVFIIMTGICSILALFLYYIETQTHIAVEQYNKIIPLCEDLNPKDS